MKMTGARVAGAAAILAAALTAAALPAWPQSYPSRPIRLIVSFPPGGTGDILGRIIAGQLSNELGQSFAVENRSGAGGTIGARDVAKAEPDGYTLTVGQTPEIAVNPYFMKEVGYDPQTDLQPIALAGVVPLALVVPANSPFSTVAQWVAALRAKQPLTFASAGIGTPGHIGGEMLKLKLKLKIKLRRQLVHVPYKGAGPAMNDVAGGQVDFYFPGYPAAVPLTQGGKVKLLAVTSAKPSPNAPNIPTVAAATGLPDFDFTLWAGFGPRGMPIEITSRLNAAINKVIVEPEIMARLQANGADVRLCRSTKPRLSCRLKSKYQSIIKAADLKPE